MLKANANAADLLRIILTGMEEEPVEEAPEAKRAKYKVLTEPPKILFFKYPLTLRLAVRTPVLADYGLPKSEVLR